MRQIVFDTETTGMKKEGKDPSEGHRIIEIACFELIDREYTGHSFHQLINPERPIDPEAASVHHIYDADVAKKPTFAQIFPELWAYWEGADELIAHNMPFDQAFLNRELALLGVGFRLEERFHLVDTLELAKKQFAGQRNNLDALCKRFGIDASQRTHHSALIDTRLLLEVYLKLTGGQDYLFSPEAFVESTPQNENTRSLQSALGLHFAPFYASEANQATHQEISQALIKAHLEAEEKKRKEKEKKEKAEKERLAQENA